jgi:hypothetical protein
VPQPAGLGILCSAGPGALCFTFRPGSALPFHQPWLYLAGALTLLTGGWLAFSRHSPAPPTWKRPLRLLRFLASLLLPRVGAPEPGGLQHYFNDVGFPGISLAYYGFVVF